MKINYLKIAKIQNKIINNTDISFQSFFNLLFDDRHLDFTFIEETQGYKTIKHSYRDVKNIVINARNFLSTILLDKQTVAIYMSNSIHYLVVFLILLSLGKKIILLQKDNCNSVSKDYLEKLHVNIDFFIVDQVIDQKNHLLAKDISFNNQSNNKLEIINGSTITFLTSGTTGDPKTCVYSAKNIFYEFKNSLEIVKKQKAIVQTYKGVIKTLCLLPFYHIFGMLANFLWICIYRPIFVIPSSIAPKELLSLVTRNEITHLLCVPLFYETIAHKALNLINSNPKQKASFERACKISYFYQKAFGKFGLFLSKQLFKPLRSRLFGNSVLFMITGGAHIHKSILNFYNLIGYPLYNGYGATELGIFSLQCSQKISSRLNPTIGVPFKRFDYKILNGSLWINKDCISDFTHGSTQIINNKTYYNTKDLIKQNKRGDIIILGRDDSLYTGPDGKNYYIDHLESLIDYQKEIKAHCIIIKDEKLLLVCQIGDIYKDILSEKVIIKLSTKVNNLVSLGYPPMQIFLTFDSLLENGATLSKTHIQANITNGLIKIFPITDFSNDPCDVSELFKSFVLFLKKHFNVFEDITPETNFFTDLSFSSFDYYQMLGLIESEYGISIDNTKLFSTIKDILVILNEAFNV